jgi:hypothetical protein
VSLDGLGEIEFFFAFSGSFWNFPCERKVKVKRGNALDGKMFASSIERVKSSTVSSTRFIKWRDSCRLKEVGKLVEEKVIEQVTKEL